MDLIEILVCLIIVSLSSADNVKPITPDHKTTADTAPDSAITFCGKQQAPGFFCADCHTLVRCYRQEGNWTGSMVKNCTEDKSTTIYCDVKSRTCSNIQTESCGEKTEDFICGTDGIYPDPSDCGKFRACSNSNPSPCRASCGKNQVFSLEIRGCVAKKATTKCKLPSIDCNSGDGAGTWPDHRDIYYICLPKTDQEGHKLFLPYWYQCENGTVFDVKQQLCVQGNNSDTSGTNTDPNTKCTRGDIIPNTFDKQIYYVCDRTGQLIEHKCPIGTMFDVRIKSCNL